MILIKKPYTPVILIAINVLIFVLQNAGMDYRIQAALWRPETPMYHTWQWFTHLFLHDSVPHIMFNMWTLAMFATPLLYIWTEKKFLLLYFGAGLVAAMAYLPFANEYTMMLGASGAVYGLLAAFAVCFPRAPVSLIFVPIAFPAKYFVTALVAYELFAQLTGISLFGDNIAHMAHVGGAIFGALFAFWWRRGVIQQKAA